MNSWDSNGNIPARIRCIGDMLIDSPTCFAIDDRDTTCQLPDFCNHCPVFAAHASATEETAVGDLCPPTKSQGTRLPTHDRWKQSVCRKHGSRIQVISKYRMYVHVYMYVYKYTYICKVIVGVVCSIFWSVPKLMYVCLVIHSRVILFSL